MLEAVTWRASADWGALLGFDAQALDEVNRMAVSLLVEVRAESSDTDHPYPISGCLGPRGDGYRPGLQMTVDAAATYHRRQVEALADTEADLITALTLTYPAEASGIALAVRDAGMPVALSFTVETDGRLADGMTPDAAIRDVDDATDAYPAYHMINCAHPTHFGSALDPDAPWTRRIRGIRANASGRSHTEPDSASELDSGDPVAFGRDYAEIRSRFPNLTVLGGCCGTDRRHIGRLRRPACDQLQIRAGPSPCAAPGLVMRGSIGPCVRRSARATGRHDPCGGRTPRSFRPVPRAATSALHRCHADSRDRRP